MVFTHKIKLSCHYSLKNLINVFIRIQHVFQVGITENHKLNYTNVDFEFLLEVQQYGTTLLKVRKSETLSCSVFKSKIKNKLLNFEDDVTFFSDLGF